MREDILSLYAPGIQAPLIVRKLSRFYGVIIIVICHKYWHNTPLNKHIIVLELIRNMKRI